MANKTIPELPEIDLLDLSPTHLSILETATETHKVRMSSLSDYFFLANRLSIPVEFDGIETGEKEVDVSAYTLVDATTIQWMLKDPAGNQMPATGIRTPDAATVIIDTGDFALDAGTYTLLGV